MAEYKATIHWQCTSSSAEFLKGRYSREHTWTFDGGVTVPASPAPSSVPAPWSNPASVDPEEAFVAAVSSCHMLTFLFLACKAGFQVDRYEDEASGVMTKNERGVRWVSRIVLRPKIVYGRDHLPTAAEVDRLHRLSHEQCYIANSIRTEVVVESAPERPRV